MTWLLVILIPLLVVLAALTVIDVFRNVVGGWAIAGWVTFVVLLPVIGALAYWLTRRGTPETAERAYLAQSDLRRERERAPIDRSGF